MKETWNLLLINKLLSGSVLFCEHSSKTLAKSMKQVESLVRGLMPDKSSRDTPRGDEGQTIRQDRQGQAARLAVCLQEVRNRKLSANHTLERLAIRNIDQRIM